MGPWGADSLQRVSYEKDFCDSDGAADDGPDDDAATADAAAARHRPRETAEDRQKLSLMAEYLKCSLQPGIYISFPSLDDDDHDALSFVQVLAIDQKCITPEQCQPLEDNDSGTQVSCQPLERMIPLGDIASSQQADVYIFEDDRPLKIHMALSPDDRPHVLRWHNAGQSGLYDCCISLRDPKPLMPDIDLLNHACPALCLLDALAERGWTGIPKVVVHTANSDLVFDRRKPMEKKRYYQCLLIHEELFQADLAEFRSGRPQTYYAYILKYRKLPPVNKPMKQLQDDMKARDDGHDLRPPLPVLMPTQPISFNESDEIVCDGAPVLALPAPTGPTGTSDASPDPSPHHDPSDLPLADGAVVDDDDDADDNGDDGHDDDDDEIAADPEPARMPSAIVPNSGDWPDSVDGFALQIRSGRAGGTHNYNTRIGVVCPCCIFKSRSTALLRDELGPMAPVIFLGCWLQAMGDADHRNYKPSLSDMQAYKALHFPD